MVGRSLEKVDLFKERFEDWAMNSAYEIPPMRLSFWSVSNVRCSPSINCPDTAYELCFFGSRCSRRCQLLLRSANKSSERVVEEAIKLKSSNPSCRIFFTNTSSATLFSETIKAVCLLCSIFPMRFVSTWDLPVPGGP